MKIQFLSRRSHFKLLCKELALHNIECEILDNKKSRNFLSLPSQYYTKSIRSDLIVTHNPYHGLYGAKSAKLNGKVKKIAFRLKADHWIEQKSTNIPYKNRLGYVIKKMQYDASINYVDFVIAISEYMSKIATQRGLDKKCYVMYNGVDIEKFRERTPDLRYKSELLCVMNFDLQQKIQPLYELFELYKEMKLPYQITCLGDGLFLTKIQAHVNQLGLQDKVHFTGYVSNPEMYYSNCKFVIHPSHLESFGMTFLEAGASSKPCIAYNIGSVPEIIVNSKTGYIVSTPYEFIDKIDRLMQNKQELNHLGKCAKERIYSKFTWYKIVDTFIDILKSEGLLDEGIQH